MCPKKGLLENRADWKMRKAFRSEHIELLLSHLKTVSEKYPVWEVQIKARSHSDTFEIGNKRLPTKTWASQQIKVWVWNRATHWCSLCWGCRHWCERSHQGWMGEKRRSVGTNEKGLDQPRHGSQREEMTAACVELASTCGHQGPRNHNARERGEEKQHLY